MSLLTEQTIGFIGAGRITNIILHAWEKHPLHFEKILVYDVNPEKTEHLINTYTHIEKVDSIQTLAKRSKIIFLAVHPPVVSEVLSSIRSTNISEDVLIISLLPKITIAKITELLGKTHAIARVIPNAPSYMGKGYNVYCTSEEIDENTETWIKQLFLPLGSFKKVNEPLLESYATITGMGPTFLWFLFNEFYLQALKTGMNQEQAKEAVNEMIKGASDVLFNSALTYEQTLNLIPAYPFKENEETIKNIYRTGLEALYQKLKL